MEWKLSSLNLSTLIYYWTKFFGLAPVTLKNSRFYPGGLANKLYMITIAVMYLVLLPIALSEELEGYEGKNSDHVLRKCISVLQVHLAYLGSPSIFILLVSTSGKIVQLMNDLCAMDTEFKSLGIVEDHGKHLKNFLVTNLTASTLFLTRHVVMRLLHPDRHLISVIARLFKDLNSLGIVLIFSHILIYIRERFALLNERLYNSFEDSQQENQTGGEGRTDFEWIEKVRALYSKLWDLVDSTTELFAAPILLCTFRFSFVLITVSYLGVSNLLDPGQLTSAEEYRISIIGGRFLSPILMITLTIAELFILLHACVTTCEQGNAAKVVLFEVWNKFELTQLKNEFLVFSFQLMHKPVPAVSVFGFVDLDYTFLLKTFGAVIAYNIVLIQFD